MIYEEREKFSGMWWENKRCASSNKKNLVCKRIVIFSLVYFKNMIQIEHSRGEFKRLP